MSRPDRPSRVQQPGPLRWFAGLPCLVAASVVAVVFTVSWRDLPDPMAVHFDEGGDVNRSASPVEMLLISSTVGPLLSAGRSSETVTRLPAAEPDEITQPSSTKRRR